MPFTSTHVTTSYLTSRLEFYGNESSRHIVIVFVIYIFKQDFFPLYGESQYVAYNRANNT